jgi:cobalt-zinc-cadmium efflux system membrane fusion protein
MNFSNAIFLLSLLLSVSCQRNQKKETDMETQTMDVIRLTDIQRKNSGVETAALETKTLSRTVAATGALDVPPQNLVDISAPLGGFVKNTSLLQGMKVKKGDILAELQHPDYIQLQQDYLNNASQLQFLETEYQRQVELARENVNAQKTLQQSKAQFESMRANVQGVKAKLLLLNINAEQLATQGIVSFIRIPSPIDGFVTEVNINIGKYVAPADIMMKLVNTEHMHAELRVFEKDIAKIKVGQKVAFHLVNEGTERFAEVYLIGREITPDRTVRIHCHLAKEDPQLLPGMFISATIETDQETMLVLPNEAIVNHEGKTFIFIPTANQNEFKMTPVEIVLQQGESSAIALPVNVSKKTQVVMKGAHTLLAMMFNMEE